MRKIGLKALSDSLGLAEGTVSRALNGYADIAPGTRQRVQEAADRLGYRPHSSARRLATGSAECIGYVLPWRDGPLVDPFLAVLLDGLAAAAAARNWDLTIAAPRSPEDEIAQLDRLSRSGRVNGLVISRTLVRDPRVDRLRRLGVPFVVHGRVSGGDDCSWFDIDGRAAFRAAVAHLVGLGHRRIALIGGADDYFFARERRAGYREGLCAHGLDPDPVLDVTSDMTDSGGHGAMRRLLALARVPTAVVCLSDMVAWGAMKAMHQAGRMPGRDISVIGYDGLPFGDHSNPPLTTMEQPLQEAGTQISRMLFALIDGAAPADHQALWPAVLKRRETDRPPPDSTG